MTCLGSSTGNFKAGTQIQTHLNQGLTISNTIYPSFALLAAEFSDADLCSLEHPHKRPKRLTALNLACSLFGLRTFPPRKPVPLFNLVDPLNPQSP